MPFRWKKLAAAITITIINSYLSSNLAAAPVKVFILAGQSNMEGKAKISLLKSKLERPETHDEFSHLQDAGEWKQREDVWIKFLERHGALSVGYGSPNCIGPELQFGNVVGDHFEAPVLIIKTAWGGKSLYRDFRPPSSGPPSRDIQQALLEKERSREPGTSLQDIEESFGYYYRAMLEEIDETLANLEHYVPNDQGQGYEIAGFVWFQGWSDSTHQEYSAAYTENLIHFIQDVRKDLNAPHMPFVVGQLGVGGIGDRRKQAFKEAQAAVADHDDFQDNVRVVRTDLFWDTKADAVYKKGWQENLEEWKSVASDFPFHYFGSPSTFLKIGNAFGLAILALQPGETKSFYDPIKKDIEGWTVRVDPKLLAEKELSAQAFTALANHLQRVKYIVPADRVEQLQRLPIWIELENPALKAMQYHPSRGWLLANNHDPRLVKHVHIPQARDLLKRSTWAKHPYVVLHELAHAYHDQVLSFDAPKIIEAYEAAKDEGIYEEVLLYTGRKVRHYGLSNPKEYFAESTEAYFGVNDFYPFVRAELQEHDPRMHEVLKTIWGSVD